MRVSFPLVSTLGFLLLANGNSPARAQDPATPTATPGATPTAKELAAERAASRRAQNEMRLRAMMSDLGIEAATQQDALIAYLAEDEAGKLAVRVPARRLVAAVRKGLVPERIRPLIATYKAAIDADRERRRAAQTALDAQIGFSLSPRLEASLWLLGVLGDGHAGLPASYLMPRPPKTVAPEASREVVNPREATGRRGGVVRGIVTRKAQGWIEVREGNGATDRYLPFWMDDQARFDPITGAPLSKTEIARINSLALEALARVKVGEPVRLFWAWSERKRVVRLDLLQSDATPPNRRNDNPKTLNNAPRAPISTPNAGYGE